MNYQNKQPLSSNSQYSGKYSLRQHLQSQKPARNKPALIVIPPFKNKYEKSTIPQSNMSPYIQNSRVSSYRQKQEQNSQYNCFSFSKQDFTLSKEGPIKTQGGYRTPSTNLEGQFNSNQKMEYIQDSSRNSEREVKLSLRTHKKQLVSKPASRIVRSFKQHRMSEQRHKTDISYSSPNDFNATEQRNQEHDNSKYSLKSPHRLTKKPQVLVSLNYQDLQHPIQHPLSSKSLSQPFMTNVYQMFQGNSFCSIGKGNGLGCKCRPKCYWVNNWMEIIGSQEIEKHHRIKNEKEHEANLKQIQRDLHRTQPDHESFQSQKMIDMLKQVLIGYAQADQEVGYVQGMNFVAAALIYHTQSVQDSIKILNYIMKVCKYRNIFLNNLQLGNKIASILSEDVRRLIFDLYSHLTQEGIDLNLFASSWYFSLCGSFVPLDSMHLFIDKFIKKGFAGINELIIAILLKKKEDLIELQDSQLMLQFSNKQMCEFGQSINWIDLRKKSDNLMLRQFQI